MNKLFLIILLFISGNVFADTILENFDEYNVPILNEELRQTGKDIEGNVSDISTNATDIDTNTAAIAAITEGLWEVDGTEHQLITADEVDMQSKKIINVTDPVAAQDAATKAYVDAITPAGVIRMYGGASAPTGWLECDGSAVSRTTYATLFAVISTTYGVGDGSTTFNLPTFTNKFARGNTPGTGGGADTHSHADTLAAPAHTHDVPYSGWTYDGAFAVGRLVTHAYGNADLCATADKATGAASATALTGSVTDGANIPAYTAIMFIVKY